MSEELTGAAVVTESWTFSRAEAMRDIWPGAWFESLTDQDFHATVLRRQFPQMRMEGIEASPYRCQRTSLDVAAYPTDSLSINVVMEGQLHMQEGPLQYRAGPGDVFVHRNNAFSFECTTATRSFRAVVAPRLLPPVLDKSRALGLCPPSMLTRAYSRFADEVLAPVAEDRSKPIEAAVEQSALVLQRGLLASVLREHGPRVRSREELRGQVLDYIDHRLTDPGLNIDEIIQELQISRRWLFRVFEDDSESITDGIRRRRIERATLDLEQHPEVPVQEIGRRNGFSGRDVFTRTFRDRHGCAPAEYRRARSGS